MADLTEAAEELFFGKDFSITGVAAVVKINKQPVSIIEVIAFIMVTDFED
jgi:hypothetical protein